MTNFPFDDYKLAIQNEIEARRCGVEIEVLSVKSAGENSAMVEFAVPGKPRRDIAEGWEVVQFNEAGDEIGCAKIEMLDLDGRIMSVTSQRRLNLAVGARTEVREPNYLSGLALFAARMCEERETEGWRMERFENLRKELLAPGMRGEREDRPEWWEYLRNDQVIAMQNALDRKASFVWGPPGTGKSYTLGHIAAELVRRGERVLMVGWTNASTDVGALAADDAFARTGMPAKAGDIVRCGTEIAKEAEFSERKHLMEYSATLQRMAIMIAGAENKARDARERLERARRAGGDWEAQEMAYVRAVLEVQRLKAERKDELEKLVKNAKVVCATVMSCVYNDYQNAGFDALLVDEASLIPLALWPCLLSGKAGMRVVVAGDPMQLPPVKGRSTDARTGAWMGRNVYGYLGMRDSASANEFVDAWAMAALTLQTRMRKGICEAVSGTFYGGMVTGDREGERLEWPEEARLPRAEIAIVDPARSAAPHGLGLVAPGWRKNTNAASANVVLGMLRRMEEHAPEGRKVKVLVLTPYRDQWMTYRDMLQGRKGGRVEVEACTVHRSQGSEADVVILDPVKPLSYFLTKDDAASIWCVACSRAREQLIAVGGVEEILAGRYSGRIFAGAKLAAG